LEPVPFAPTNIFENAEDVMGKEKTLPGFDLVYDAGKD
jgi:hypothetical protein